MIFSNFSAKGPVRRFLSTAFPFFTLFLPGTLWFFTATPLHAHEVFRKNLVSSVSTVRIGALANRGTEECLARWGPTAAYLERHIPGTRFEVVPLSFNEVTDRVASGKVHFIITNPTQYSVLEFRGNAHRIAGFLVPSPAGPRRVFGGVIFTRADRADIKTIDDLRGRKFAAVDAESLGGWLSALRELKAAHIDPVRSFAELRFLGTHDAVVESVLSGQSDAGTIRSSQLETMAGQGKADLRDIRVLPCPYLSCAGYPFRISTRLYPEWPFAVVGGVDDDLSRRVAVALMTMEANDPAAKASGGAGWTIPSDYSAVHELLRELRLDPYRDLGRITPAGILSQYWPHLLSATAAVLLVVVFAVRAFVLNRRLKGSMEELSLRTRDLDESREALRIERDKMVAILDSMQDDIYIADAAGRILYVNSALEKDFGAWEGRMCFEYLYDGEQPCPWCHMEKVRAGETVRWERHFPKTGKTYDIIEVPLRDSHDTVKLTIFRDITERKRTEDALRESRELLNAIVEGTSDSVYVKDVDGRFLLFNSGASRNTGRSAEEMLGRDVTSLFPEGEARKIMERDRSLMAEGGIVTHEEEVSIGGMRKVFLTTKGSLTDKQGNTTGIFGISRDITELKRIEAERLEMERRLLQTQKMESLGVLAGGIAHDFNNLLTVILGNLDMTLLKVPPDSPARPNIDKALTACQRVARLICQLLDYAGKGSFLLRDTDLNRVVHENESLFRATMAHGIELAIATRPGLPMIRADEEQIRQVIMNLVVNAVEAIGEGPGTVTVSTGSEECDEACLGLSRIEEKPLPGTFVYLDVSDTGPGMDKETLARLFEPFYTTKFMGRGLGMSVVMGIMRVHGGAIMLETGTGRGAVVRVLFPALGDT